MSAATTYTPNADALADELTQRELDTEAHWYEKQAERLRKAHNRGQISAEDKLLETCRLISTACGADATGDLRYSSGEVLGWFGRAVEMGAEVPTVGAKKLRTIFTAVSIPNARFRERFLELTESDGLGSEDLAKRLGLIYSDKGDSTAVERLLGLATRPERDADGEEYLTVRLFIDYDQAVALADVLCLDYTAVGV